MSYTPTSPGAVAAKKLRRMLSLSSTFIARVGNEDSDVLGRIYYDEQPVDSDTPFPQAVVCFGGATSGIVAGGVQVHLRPSFSLDLYVWLLPLDETWDEQSQRLELWDAFAGIYDDICLLSGSDDSGSDDGYGHLSIVDASWSMKVENDNKDRNANGLRAVGMYSFRVGDA